MRRGMILPLIAVGMFSIAIYHVIRTATPLPSMEPPQMPARSPFRQRVAGLGLVEAATENISIGTHDAGVIAEVMVKVGQKVAVGDPLFRIDDRAAQADLLVRQASLAAAKAQHERLLKLPREEELPGSAARVREAVARLADEEVRLARAERLFERGALSEEELTSRRQAFQIAKEQKQHFEAEDDLLRAGAWESDLAVAQAAVFLAKAQVDQQQTTLNRLTVSAPVAGEVLQVNVRRGEFVQQSSMQALLVLGNTEVLHIRVSIDEEEIPRFHEKGKATAYLRGRGDQPVGMDFLRVEPLVTPKRSLTGSPNERVDTRVLQVIYAAQAGGPRLFVGQQLDIYIEIPADSTAPRNGETKGATK